MQIVYNTFTDDFDYVGTGGGPPGNDYHVARFIVSAGGASDGANYTTLALAYAAAVSAGGRQTIFLQPGTYNIGTQALSPNINLAAFDCDALTPNVTINGKMTANITGTCSFSGINFTNATDNILSISGSGTSLFKFSECVINVAGNAPAFLNTNANAGVQVFSCKGDISGTDTYFDMTGGGVLIQDTFFFNNALSTTQNIFDNCSLDLESSTFDAPVVCTGTGGDLSVKHSTMIVLDTQIITTSGGPNSDLIILNSHIDSNNATAIEIGTDSTMTIANSSVGSTAANAITGAGVLLYTPISFTKSSKTVSTATQTALAIGPDILPAKSGTAGEVWTSNGAGVPPTFQAPSTGSPTAFRAHLNANTAANITGDGTFVTVPFDTVDYDIGSGYNSGTYIYTVPVGKGGIYQINYTVFTYRVAGTNNVELLNFVINGATVVRNYEMDFETVQTSGELTLTSGAQYQLSAGDTVQITCAVGGAAKNIGFAGTYCVFSMIKVG